MTTTLAGHASLRGRRILLSMLTGPPVFGPKPAPVSTFGTADIVYETDAACIALGRARWA